MSLSPLERHVVDAVDPGGILSDLKALVEIPSVGGSAAEVAVQQWCADRLATMGADVDHWPMAVDELRAAADYPGEEVPRDDAYGCVGTLGPGEVALVLAGHTDVVPPGDPAAWTSEPWQLRRDANQLYGRGTCDMKGGVAAILGAVTALRVAGVRLERALAVHCVIGEEDGGLGAYGTLRRGHTGAACVIAEPTNGAVIVANAGSVTFRLEVSGRACHGATRLAGVSAFDAALPVFDALRKLEAGRNQHVDPVLAHLELPFALSVGVIRAGDWASTVPDLLVAEGRVGVRLDEPVAVAQAQLEAAVAGACGTDPWLDAHPVRVSWPGGVFASGRLPPGHPLLDDVRLACRDSGGWYPAARGAPYGSDLRLYAAAGIPTVQLGPGDVAVAHSADERVTLDDRVACARTYALLALRRCG